MFGGNQGAAQSNMSSSESADLRDQSQPLRSTDEGDYEAQTICAWVSVLGSWPVVRILGTLIDTKGWRRLASMQMRLSTYGIHQFIDCTSLVWPFDFRS